MPTQLERAADAVADLPVVSETRVTESVAYGSEIIEVDIHPSCDRVPPAVLLRLGSFDCGVLDVSTQGPDRQRSYLVDAQ
jgi:hypothetical protein